jgi:hypothetical protein
MLDNASNDANRVRALPDCLPSLALGGDRLYAGSANGAVYAVSMDYTHIPTPRF